MGKPRDLFKKMGAIKGTLGFADSSVGKESTCNAGDPSLIPGLGRSAGEGIGTHSSILGLPLWLSWLRICLQCGRPEFNPWVGKIPWRRQRLPTPVFWPREFHGLYSPWGRKELGTTERLSLRFSSEFFSLPAWILVDDWSFLMGSMLNFFTLSHVNYAHTMVIWKPNLITLSGIYEHDHDHELLLLSLLNCSAMESAAKHTGPGLVKSWSSFNPATN